MKAYRIKNWSEHFENPDSKKTKGPLAWVKIPTRHDGKGYRRISRNSQGVQAFCAWNLIVQVAAKAPLGMRGVLADENGPLVAEDLADATGFPVEIFEIAFKLLIQKGIEWIEEFDYPEASGDIRENPGVSGGIPAYPEASGDIRENPGVSGGIPAYPEASGDIPLEESRVEESRREEIPPPTAARDIPPTPPPALPPTAPPVEQAASIPPRDPGRFNRACVDSVLAAYPRKVGLGGARMLVEYALCEIAQRPDSPTDPAAWLREKVERFAKSWMGQRGDKTCLAKTWFEEKRFDDDPDHWEKKIVAADKIAPTNASTGPPAEWNGADLTPEEIRGQLETEREIAREREAAKARRKLVSEGTSNGQP